jgi:hypothetical protein
MRTNKKQAMISKRTAGAKLKKALRTRRALLALSAPALAAALTLGTPALTHPRAATQPTRAAATQTVLTAHSQPQVQRDINWNWCWHSYHYGWASINGDVDVGNVDIAANVCADGQTTSLDSATTQPQPTCNVHRGVTGDAKLDYCGWNPDGNGGIVLAANMETDGTYGFLNVDSYNWFRVDIHPNGTETTRAWVDTWWDKFFIDWNY